MSARMNGLVEEPNEHDADIHQWIEGITEGTDFEGIDASRLAIICSAAGDPLEIAAALEVAGVSHTVATDRYGRADVFSLAQTLWNRIPIQPTPVVEASVHQPGNWLDLLRGLLYIAPAPMILALSRGLDREFAGWTLPLAVTWGWGLGQMTAFAGYRMRSRADTRREAEVTGRFLIGSIISTLVLSLVAAMIFGGDLVSISVATALVTFMVASSILLLHQQQQWSALLIAPGVVLSCIVLIAPLGTVPGPMVALFIAGSFIAVLLRSTRHVHLRWPSGMLLGHRDFRISLGHLLHGLLCGLAVVAIVIQGEHLAPALDDLARVLVPVPMLATLGVMEWQLRTFRSRASGLTQTMETMDRFPERAWAQCRRSLLIYLTAISTVTALVWIIAAANGQRIPSSVLAVQIVLGISFLCDLMIVTLDRLDLVLKSWLLGLTVGLAWLAVEIWGFGTAVETALWHASCAGGICVCVALAGCTRNVASTAMNH